MKRLIFSLKFYCYIFFAVLLDMSMTTIGVTTIGFHAEKNPYVYNHMISGTYWSSFIPELIIFTILLAVATTFISALIIYYFLWISKLEFKSKGFKDYMRKCARLTTMMLFAALCSNPGLFFSQGVLWIVAIILQDDYTTWVPVILLQIIVAVLVIIYIILGIHLLSNEIPKTINYDLEEDLLYGIPRVFRN